MTNKLITFFIIGLIVGLLAGGGGFYAAERAGLIGGTTAGGGPQATPDPDQHDDEEDHVPGVVHLTPEKLALLHLEAVQVRRGSLTSVIELPGQVEWNTDRLAHVTPRLAGVVLTVEKTLGD